MSNKKTKNKQPNTKLEFAEELNLPLIYVRSKPKDHGRGKQIEGVLEKGAKTVLIDDLLSTGGSVLKAVDAAKNEGADVIGVGVIFSYELPAVYQNFEKAKMPFTTLTNYSELLELLNKKPISRIINLKL